MQPLNQPLQPNPLLLPEPKYFLQKIFDFLSYEKAYFWGTYTQTKDVDTRYNWVVHQLKVLNKESGEASFWVQWNTQGHQVYREIQKEIEILRPLNLRDLSSSEESADAIQQLVTRDKAIEHLNAIQGKIDEVQGSLDKLSNEPLEPSWPQWLLKHFHTIGEVKEKIQSLEPLQKFFVVGERGAIEEIPGVDVESLKKRLSHTLFQMAEKHFVSFVEKDYRSYQQQVQEKIAHLEKSRKSYLEKTWNYVWSFWGNYWEKEHPEDASFLRGRVDYLKTLHLATALPQLKDFREEVSSPGSLVSSADSLRTRFEKLFPSQAEGSLTKICRVVKALYCPSNLPSLPVPQDWEEHRHIGVGLGDTPSALALQLLFSDPFLAQFAIGGKGQSQEIKQLYKEYLRADWNCHWVSWQEFIRNPSNEDTLWLNPHTSFKKREPFKLNPLQLQNFPQTAKAALEELTAHLDSQANPLFHTLVTRKRGSAEKQEVQQAIIDLEWTSIDQPQDLKETPPYQPQTLELLLKEKFSLTQPQEGKEFTQFSKFPEVLLIHLSKSPQTKKEPFGIMEHLYLNSDFSFETSSGACYELVSFLVDKTHYRKTGFGYFSIQNDVVESVSRGIFLDNAKTSTLAVFRRSSEFFTAEEIHAQVTQNLYRFYIDLYRPLTIEAALGRSKYTAPVNQQRGMQCLTSFVSSLVCSPSFPRKQIGLFPRNPNDFTEYTFNELPMPFQQFLWDVWKPPSQSSQQPNPSFLQDIRSKLLLQADELPLDIPPRPDEQKYDKDGFVLTLLADRLFKYLQKNPEKILHDPMQKALYLATHHAIAQVAAARRIQKIRLSALVEETVQVTTTLAIASFTKNKKSHLRQQAISTTSRVFSIIVDPLQESPRLQKIMQIGTSVVLCGETLDDPNLSEKDKDNIAALFFAKSIFSHAPGSVLPAIPEKHRHLYDSTTDIALTLSTSYLKETPTPIASWVTSYALRRLDRSLVLPLSPDTPQSTYNFYAARIISPILSNSTLHTLAAEKALKAIQDLTKRLPSPKFSESLDPEEQAKYPKQEPTLEDLKLKAEYEQKLAEYEKWQKDSAAHTLEETNAKNELIQKEAGVTNAQKYYDEKEAKGQKTWGPKQAREAEKKITKALNNLIKAITERDQAQKLVYNLQGIEIVPEPKVRPKKPKTVVGKVWKWTKENVAMSGEMPVTKMPIYTTKPSTASDRYVPRESPRIQEISQPRANMGHWEGIQAMQENQMLNANMAYQSPSIQSPQLPQTNYQIMWGQGLASNVQLPPSDISGLGRNVHEHVLPGMKRYPDGDRTQSNIPKWLRSFASGGEVLDPQERINRNTQGLVAITKDITRKIGAVADELRSFGCVNAQFKNGKVTLKFDRSISERMDQFISQHLPNMDHVPNFRYVEFTASITNDVMLQAFMMPLFQAQKAKPLLDRALVRPQGFGQQVRAIEGLRPVYRSGLSFPKLGLMPGQPKLLTERTVLKLEGLGIKASKGINRSNNHQFITWVESGQTRTASIGEMSHAGTFHDRGGLTKAGRAFEKHGKRVDTVFPKPTGTIHQKNTEGQRILDGILNHPDKKIYFPDHLTERYGFEVLDVFIPGKHGARFSREGKEMIGFLEPR